MVLRRAKRFLFIFEVILEGVVGKGIHGDIAVDDFCLLEEEECQTIYGNG